LAESTGSNVINFDVLYTNGLVSKSDLVKILSRGTLSTAIEVHAKGFSSAAKAAIEAAGGQAIVD
jgi:large subunit ribosomal protein L15